MSPNRSRPADLVHLAGPVLLGACGGAAARRLGLPVVAVYATDLAAYARTYRFGSPAEAFCWRRLRRIHNAADRTLAPSQATAASLREHGFARVQVWGRGVDTVRFHPASAVSGSGASSPPAARYWPGTSVAWPPRNASTCWPTWPGCLACD